MYKVPQTRLYLHLTKLQLKDTENTQYFQSPSWLIYHPDDGQVL